MAKDPATAQSATPATPLTKREQLANQLIEFALKGKRFAPDQEFLKKAVTDAYTKRLAAYCGELSDDDCDKIAAALAMLR